MKSLFQVPSTISSIRTLADNTIRIQCDCQEMPPDEMAVLFQLKGKLGYFLFKQNTIEPEDVPDEEAPEFDGEKSLSERLRNVLYVYWKQLSEEGKTQKTFNQFRKDNMEKLIQLFKDKLE